MALTLLRRGITFTPVFNSHFLSRVLKLSSKSSINIGEGNEVTELASTANKQITSPNYSSGIHLSPLLSQAKPHTGGYDIELVDPDTWQVSSSLVEAWRGTDSVVEMDDEPVDQSRPVEHNPDFDDIEDMRIRGNLFYKLDKGSKEYEEYNLEFRGRKSSKNKNDKKESIEKESPNQNDKKESKKKANPNLNLASKGEKFPKLVKNKSLTLPYEETESTSFEKKRLRTPTFNQLTGPYHEPFCLDIYISKSSVRACIVHRVTSKVVAVAHSISKDMKFDLGSTRDATACAAVGGVLAQRALADDIHDVVYTPRKGDKLEGKLQIVLQSIMENGVKVKVKLKKRNTKKSGSPVSTGSIY